MSKKYLTNNRSKRSIKRNRRKRGLTKRYNKSRRGGYNKSKKKMLGGMDAVPVPNFAGLSYIPMNPGTSTRPATQSHGARAIRTTHMTAADAAAAAAAAAAAEQAAADKLAADKQSIALYRQFKARGAAPAPPPPIGFAGVAKAAVIATKLHNKWSAWASGTTADKALSEKALSEQNDLYKRTLDDKNTAHNALKLKIEHKKKLLVQKLDDPDTKATYTRNINAWISQMMQSVPHSRVFAETTGILGQTITKTGKTDRPLKQLYNRAHTISEDSVLFVIDMQNDFVGPSEFQTTNKMDMFGARFAVSEGPYIDDKMVDLIEKWSGKVILSRDYHPHNHCSFASSGKGNYPTHCVQGTRGSYFTDNMEKALMTRFMDQTKRNNTYIVFKGCWESIDSYGAAKYDIPGGEWANTDGTLAADAFYVKQPQDPSSSVAKETRPDPDPSIHNPKNVLHDARQAVDACSKIDLTGSFYLQCSALTELGLSLDAAEGSELRALISNPSFKQAFLDAIRSGPDVNAINEKNERLNRSGTDEPSNTINKRVEEIITGDPNIYVVGLALDYCCTDTAVNLSKAGYTDVNLVMNLCRPPVIPLGVPGLTAGGAPFADNRHMVGSGGSTKESGLRWLTKRLALLRGTEDGSDGSCPAWWLQKEILPNNVNLIWADPE